MVKFDSSHKGILEYPGRLCVDIPLTGETSHLRIALDRKEFDFLAHDGSAICDGLERYLHVKWPATFDDLRVAEIAERFENRILTTFDRNRPAVVIGRREKRMAENHLHGCTW